MPQMALRQHRLRRQLLGSSRGAASSSIGWHPTGCALQAEWWTACRPACARARAHDELVLCERANDGMHTSGEQRQGKWRRGRVMFCFSNCNRWLTASKCTTGACVQEKNNNQPKNSRALCSTCGGLCSTCGGLCSTCGGLCSTCGGCSGIP
jgi:hypothetical protein